MNPLDLDNDDLSYLADIRSGNCIISYVKRSNGGAQQWMAVHKKLDIEMAVEFEESEEALRDVISAKLDAYDRYLEICHEFGSIAPCRLFLAAIYDRAAALGADLSSIPDVVLLRRWKEHSDAGAVVSEFHLSSPEDLDRIICTLTQVDSRWLTGNAKREDLL